MQFRTTALGIRNIEVDYEPKAFGIGLTAGGVSMLRVSVDDVVEVLVISDHGQAANPWRVFLQRLMDGEAFDVVAADVVRAVADTFTDAPFEPMLPLRHICQRHSEALAVAGMAASAARQKAWHGGEVHPTMEVPTWERAPTHERHWALARVHALLEDLEPAHVAYGKRRQLLLSTPDTPRSLLRTWDELGLFEQRLYLVFENAVWSLAQSLDQLECESQTARTKRDAASQPAPTNKAEN